MFTWVRFIAGFILMIIMGYVWLYVNEFEIILFAIPAALMGINPMDLMRNRR